MAIPHDPKNCVHTIDRVFQVSGLWVAFIKIDRKADGVMKFFLEGPKLIGKSTLLREQLLKTDYRVGGFYVQRLLSENDQVMGFQLRSAESLLLKTSSYEWTEEACFLRRVNGQMVPDLKVFETVGRHLLEQAVNQSFDVILLDEIGGLELQVPDFYRPLLQLLNSSQKIIGVYKSFENYQQLARRQRVKVTAQRREIERLIHGSCLTVDDHLDRTTAKVSDYLNGSI